MKRISLQLFDQTLQHPGLVIELFERFVVITSGEEAKIMGHFNFRFKLGTGTQCNIQ